MDVRVGDILLMKKTHLRPGDHDPPCQGRTPYQKNHPPGGAVAVPYATKFA